MNLRERLFNAQGEPSPAPPPSEQPAPVNGHVPAGAEEQAREPAAPPSRQREKAALAERLRESAAAPSAPGGALRERRPTESHRGDPFASLKTRVHRACIDKLGSQLFGAAIDDDLTEVVRQTVEEELTADRTPLT